SESRFLSACPGLWSRNTKTLPVLHPLNIPEDLKIGSESDGTCFSADGCGCGHFVLIDPHYPIADQHVYFPDHYRLCRGPGPRHALGQDCRIDRRGHGCHTGEHRTHLRTGRHPRQAGGRCRRGAADCGDLNRSVRTKKTSSGPSSSPPLSSASPSFSKWGWYCWFRLFIKSPGSPRSPFCTWAFRWRRPCRSHTGFCLPIPVRRRSLSSTEPTSAWS